METILVLIYTTGSLPQTKAYSYTINFYNDSTASIKIFRGYDESPAYTDTTTYDRSILDQAIQNLSRLPEPKTLAAVAGTERREIIYLDGDRTLRRIITPQTPEDLRIFEQLLLLYDEDFHFLLSNHTQKP